MSVIGAWSPQMADSGLKYLNTDVYKNHEIQRGLP
jgi:hypothetical protein